MPSQDAMTRIRTQAIKSPKSPSTRKRRTPRGPAWAAYPSEISVPRDHCSKLRKTSPPITTIQNSHHGAFTGLPPDRTIRRSNGLMVGVADFANGPGQSAERTQLLGLHGPVGEGDNRGAEADDGDEEPGDLDDFDHRWVRWKAIPKGDPP